MDGSAQTGDDNLVSIERKVDLGLCTAALIAVFAFFLWLSIPVVQWGVSHADDAFFALVAHNIATGRGYGFPASSDEFLVFHQFISTGPALMLPIAFVMWIFGRGDQLPGFVSLNIFILQVVAVAIVLVRRFGWAPTCGFLVALLWLLMLASVHDWFFGAFLGEPVAFGFILIGIALLAVAASDRAIAAAALCFSLAFLTKQMSMFAVAGILAGWLVVSAYDRVGLRVLFRRVVIIALVGLSLPLAFEAVKLATLGLAGYRALWKTSMVNAIAEQVIGTGDTSARLHTFLTVLARSYLSPILMVGLAIGSLILLVLLRRSNNEGRDSVVRLGVFAWAGAAVYLAYILLVSILWPRYFWIGIAVLFIAISAPLLALGSKLRVATILVLLVGTLGLGLYRPLLLVRQYVKNSKAPAERAAVVKLLADHPDLPYAAHFGHSIWDVVYLRDPVGTWTVEPDVIRLQDRDFIAIINEVFTDKESRFYKSAVATCEQLTPPGRLTAYRCGERFWEMYRSGTSVARAPNSPVAESLPYYGAVDKRDCETVEGWVMNKADTEADIKVDLYVDDKLAETVPAKTLRSDLIGKLGTGRYGFSFKIPPAFKDERPHLINVKVAGSSYGVPFYQGVSQNLECKQ